MDVMCYEVFAEEAEALRRYLPKNLDVGMTSKTIQTTESGTPPATLISIRTQSLIPDAWAPQLRGILTRSSGYDHLQRFLHQARQPVACGYLPLYCPRSVAEHAVMIQFCLLRQLKRQLIQFPVFKRDHLTGHEVQNRCAVVLGVGHIGTEIAQLCRQLGMQVLGVDPVHRLQDLKYVDLAAGLTAADTLFCALPLTRETEALLDYEYLARIKPGALFINISRGEIAPLEGLQRLLNEDKLGGLGLDVFENEQSLGDELRLGQQKSTQADLLRTLHQKDNVLLTPHNAFNTAEAVDRKAHQSAQSIVQFVENGTFPSPLPESAHDL